jgi:hypothetical protein
VGITLTIVPLRTEKPFMLDWPPIQCL